MVNTVAICILTYKRPGGLSRLLDALALQQIPSDIDVRVVVVDNENSSLTRQICNEKARHLTVPLLYRAELRRGISYARNTAVEEASAFADFLVFIDDDEVPLPGWLEHLIACQIKYGADGVAGPVVPRFMSDIPEWMREGRFFEWQRHPTGTYVSDVATNNVLIRVAAIKRAGGFDATYSLTGGEDTAFFLALQKTGGRIVWSDEALVEEWIPPSRTKISWLLQRSFRQGTALALLSRESHHPAVILIRGTGRSFKGALLALVFPVVKQATTIRALQRICSGFGMMASAIGYQYEEYRQVHSV